MTSIVKNKPQQNINTTHKYQANEIIKYDLLKWHVTSCTLGVINGTSGTPQLSGMEKLQQ